MSGKGKRHPGRARQCQAVETPLERGWNARLGKARPEKGLRVFQAGQNLTREGLGSARLGKPPL